MIMRAMMAIVGSIFKFISTVMPLIGLMSVFIVVFESSVNHSLQAASLQASSLQASSLPAVNNSQAHAEGGSFAQTQLDSSQSMAQKTDPYLVPGFEGDHPPESTLDASSIGDATMKAAHSNEAGPNTTGPLAGQWLLNQGSHRQKFTLDPTYDPLIVSANQAVSDPQKTLKATLEADPAAEEKESAFKEVTCEEGGASYQKSCQKTLTIGLRVTPEVGHYNPGFCIGHWEDEVWGTKWYCGGCRGGGYVIDQYKTVEVIYEDWIDRCTPLENQVDQGLCRYETVAYGPPETRIISGEPVTRDHWLETYTYTCLKSVSDQCSSLRARGCTQIRSQCIETVGAVCAKWQQTYQCPNDSMGGHKKQTTYSTKGGQSPFCLTGNCVDSSYTANTELFRALSHLSVLKEMQTDIRNGGGSFIFKGQDRQCSRNCISFRDCCAVKGKGWGVSLHLASCSGLEKELAEWRGKNRCVMAGTYCAKKILGQCIEKKTSFCCFGTKLSRLIQEQARGQLGIGWGDPKKPDCRGLTPEELSRLDFSRMDLSELFEDIKSRWNPPSEEILSKSVNLGRIQDNMKQMTTAPMSGASMGTAMGTATGTAMGTSTGAASIGTSAMGSQK